MRNWREPNCSRGDGKWVLRLEEGGAWSGRGSQLSIVRLCLSSIREKTTPEGIYLWRPIHATECSSKIITW